MIIKIINKISKEFIKETFRFGVVGILNTIVGYGSYFILIKLHVFYIVASLCSHIFGVINSYFWNKYYTFKSVKKSTPELIRFLSVYTITFIINLGILTFLIEKLKIEKEVAGFTTLCIVTAISFLGHRFWSFNKKNK
jgi:putative flippase GtrA